MKKTFALLLALSTLFLLCSCGNNTSSQDSQVPQVARMKNICELSTMECYYHNVAKYFEENAGGHFWNKKDKHFWVEYSGQVTIGVDAELIEIQIDGDQITITMPPARVLSSKVDENTLNEDSYIFAEGSILPSAEEQTKVIGEANDNMFETASQDTKLLNLAQERAQSLIQKYIDQIGEQTNTEYHVTWVTAEETEVLPLESQEPTGSTSP